MNIEVTFKNAAALYVVAARPDSAAAFLALLCHQLTTAARGRGQIFARNYNGMFSFLSFHWLKFLFLLLQPGLNGYNKHIFLLEILYIVMANLSVKNHLWSSDIAILCF